MSKTKLIVELAHGPYCGIEWEVASKSLITLALEMPVAHKPPKVVDPPDPGLKVAMYELRVGEAEDPKDPAEIRFVYQFKEWK